MIMNNPIYLLSKNNATAVNLNREIENILPKEDFQGWEGCKGGHWCED